MSDSSSTGTESTGAPKKEVSPVRKGISLVILLVVIVVGWFQYSAVLGYNAALKALDARSQVEDKDLMDAKEADALLGRPADDPGADFTENNRTFTKKTYTWHGPIKSYTLTAFYTKNDNQPHLHHFMSEGATIEPEPAMVSTPASDIPVSRKKGRSKRAEAAPETSKSTAKNAPDKAKTAEPAVEPPKAATAPAPAKAAEPATPSAKPAATDAPAPATAPK